MLANVEISSPLPPLAGLPCVMPMCDKDGVSHKHVGIAIMYDNFVLHQRYNCGNQMMTRTTHKDFVDCDADHARHIAMNGWSNAGFSS